jgi:hypothetical protein
MAIKYLKGLYTEPNIKTTRPKGIQFPVGLKLTDGPIGTANSASSPTTGTFDVLLVAGGGCGGSRNPARGPNNSSAATSGSGGGGGAGGVRLLSANSFSELSSYNNTENVDLATGINSLPVVVGGGSGNSLFDNLNTCRGGDGGLGNWSAPAGPPSTNTAGFPGGSGGGRGAGNGAPLQSCGLGIAGQGCPGAVPLSGIGGSALLAGCCTGGLTTSFTGASVSYGNGACGARNPAQPGAANRGNGGEGSSRITPSIYGPFGSPGAPGGSGIVAIRYRNPAAPTTPLAVGGDCVCCTGGCIIHIFNSSGFLNVESQFNIN